MGGFVMPRCTYHDARVTAVGRWTITIEPMTRPEVRGVPGFEALRRQICPPSG